MLLRSCTCAVKSYLTVFFSNLYFSNCIIIFSTMQILWSWIIQCGFHNNVIGVLSPKRNIDLLAVEIIEILMILQSAARGSYLSKHRRSSPIIWSSGCLVVCCKSILKHSRCSWKLIYLSCNNRNMVLINSNQLKES